MADRHLASMRRQSEMEESTVGEESVSASPATVFQKREQSPLKTLKPCEEELQHTTVIQLFYDEKNCEQNG